MPQSHPKTLIKHVEGELSRLELSGARLLVALSGGPDSMALLHVLSRLRERFNLELFAHGVDHGLRPEAVAELELARALCELVQVPLSRSRLELERGGNLQARAREARYAELEFYARKYNAIICTAHHADDRAETLLLRLLRGASLGGLGVLPRRQVVAGVERLRLMLTASRADVLLHVERHGLKVARDPSNTDPRFMRVRVRQELLPLLEELSPGITRHLNLLADQVIQEISVGEEGAIEPALNRAQILALQRALSLGKPAEIALKEGRILRVRREDAGFIALESQANPPREA